MGDKAKHEKKAREKKRVHFELEGANYGLVLQNTEGSIVIKEQTCFLILSQPFAHLFHALYSLLHCCPLLACPSSALPNYSDSVAVWC
jgi:hypothetical protein